MRWRPQVTRQSEPSHQVNVVPGTHDYKIQTLQDVKAARIDYTLTLVLKVAI